MVTRDTTRALHGRAMPGPSHPRHERCYLYLYLSKAAKLDEPDVRAVALETGIQNYPLIVALVSPSPHGRKAPAGQAQPWHQLGARFVRTP